LIAFVEDADNRAAEEVAALAGLQGRSRTVGVGGVVLAQLGEKCVEGGGAGRARRERTRTPRRDAGPGEADSGGDAGGDEAALDEGLEPLPAPRPPPRARGAPGPGRRRCRRGGARVLPPRGRESSSPLANSSSAREGTRPSKKASTPAGGRAPTNSSATSPSAEGLDRRDALNAEARPQALVGSRRRSSPARRRRRVCPQRLRAPARAVCTGRTSRPRSRLRPGPGASARRPRSRRSPRDVDRHNRKSR